MINKLLIVISLAVALPLSAEFEFYGKIGEVSAYSGEVYVRNKSNWTKLSGQRVEIFNSDKIVTGSGRAEVVLSDGAVIRLDTGVNIHLFKKQLSGRLLSAVNRPDGYQINLMVGSLSFHSLQSKGDKQGTRIFIKTPAAQTSFDKAVGVVSVGMGGVTRLKVEEGAEGHESNGNYQEDDNLSFLERNGVLKRGFQIDPALRNSPYIAAPIEAYHASEKSKQASLWADVSLQNSNRKFNEYLESRNSRNLRASAETLIKRAQARYDFAIARIRSSMANMEDSQLETGLLGTDQKRQMTESFVDTGKMMENMASFAGEIKKISTVMDYDSQSVAFMRAASAAAIAERAVALAETAKIASVYADSQVAEDLSAKNMITTHLLRTKRISDRVSRIIKLSQTILGEFARAENQQITKYAQVFATQAIVNTATTAALCAKTLAVSSPEMLARDSTADANMGEMMVCQLSDTSLLAAERASRALFSDDEFEIYNALKATQEILKTINPDDGLYASIFQKVEKFVNSEGTSTQTVATDMVSAEYGNEFDYLDFPVEPNDLSSASRSQ